MNLSQIFKNTFLIIILSLVVSACATKKTSAPKIEGQITHYLRCIHSAMLQTLLNIWQMVFLIEYSLQHEGFANNCLY